MKTILFLLSCAIATGTAFAQQYKWTDEKGRVRYGDVPPPGVKATPLRGVPPAPAPAPAAKDGKSAASKDAKKGPLTPAEQDAEFRKRQLEASKDREKQEKEAQQAAEKRDNCARAREQLVSINSGQRIQRTDAQGERYYLDDNQRAAEAAKTQQLVDSWCK